MHSITFVYLALKSTSVTVVMLQAQPLMRFWPPGMPDHTPYANPGQASCKKKKNALKTREATGEAWMDQNYTHFSSSGITPKAITSLSEASRRVFFISRKSAPGSLPPLLTFTNKPQSTRINFRYSPPLHLDYVFLKNGIYKNKLI